jgi:hypothetical protein
MEEDDLIKHLNLKPVLNFLKENRDKFDLN